MIGCPIQNRAWILPKYLKHIKELVYDKKEIHLAFLVNNSKDDTLKLLLDFKLRYEKDYHSISVEVLEDFFYTDSRTVDRRLDKIAEVKNGWLNLRTPNDSHCLIIDSDVLVPPGTVLDLLYMDFPVSSGLCITGRVGNEYFYNIMEHVNNTMYVHCRNMPNPEYSGTPYIEVDMACSVVMYRKDVLDLPGVEFGYHRQGEDCYICEKILGYDDMKIVCDLRLFCNHVMEKENLDDTEHYIR